MHRMLISTLLLASFSFVAKSQDLSERMRPKAKAQGSSIIDSYVFNLGSHTDFYNSVQIDSSGGMRKIDFAPTIGFGLSIPTRYDFIFLPEINWVLPQEAGSSKIIKNHFMLRADMAYDPISWLRLRVGTSLMWLNQHDRGGSVQIRNGNDYSTFYYPDENRSSFNNTLDLGVEAFVHKSFSARLQTYVYSVFKQERRQVSYTLFLSYYWDQK